MFWFEVEASSAPPSAVELGPGLFGGWYDAATALGWVNADPARRLATVKTFGDDLPRVALFLAVPNLSQAELEQMSDDELDHTAAALFRSADRWGSAAVNAIRAEYSRRGLVA
jgi:hypothetical protein